MKQGQLLRINALLAATACVVLTGCASPQKPLYAWSGYQPQVYQYLKNDGSSSPEDQLLKLEEAQEKVRASGAALPPGYRAHMAMLYSKTGNNEKTLEQLTAEKQSFPESAGFMDLLLKTFAGKKN